MKQDALSDAIKILPSQYVRMQYFTIFKKWLIRISVLTFLVWVFGFNYSFVFKRKVIGEVVAAEKVIAPIALVTDATQKQLNPQIFSFSVGIKDRFSGEIFMASSEDRQWAAVGVGNCVISAFFPYPPWQFSKGGTSHNARLLRNFTNCDQLPVESWFEDLKIFFLFN